MTTAATTNGQTTTPETAKPAGETPAAGTTTTTTPAKPAEGGTAATATTTPAAPAIPAANEPAAPKTAPDKYELTVPEGSTLDDGDLKLVETFARENKLTNEEAQGVLDRQNATLVAQSARFLAETTADKEYGGDNLATTQARAKAIIDTVRPASHPRAKSFRAFLDKSGSGNNIEVISFLADLAKRTEEDSPAGSNGGSATKSVEDRLYNGQ